MDYRPLTDEQIDAIAAGLLPNAVNILTRNNVGFSDSHREFCNYLYTKISQNNKVKHADIARLKNRVEELAISETMKFRSLNEETKNSIAFARSIGVLEKDPKAIPDTRVGMTWTYILLLRNQCFRFAKYVAMASKSMPDRPSETDLEGWVEWVCSCLRVAVTLIHHLLDDLYQHFFSDANCFESLVYQVEETTTRVSDRVRNFANIFDWIFNDAEPPFPPNNRDIEDILGKGEDCAVLTRVTRDQSQPDKEESPEVDLHVAGNPFAGLEEAVRNISDEYPELDAVSEMSVSTSVDSTPFHDKYPRVEPTAAHVIDVLAGLIGRRCGRNQIIPYGNYVFLGSDQIRYPGLESMVDITEKMRMFSQDCTLYNSRTKAYNYDLGISEIARPRKMDRPNSIYAIGPIFESRIPGCFNKTKQNEAVALVCRHINVTAPETYEEWKKLIDNREDYFFAFFKGVNIQNYMPNLDEWMSEIDPIKRNKIAEIALSLSEIDFENPIYHLREFFTKSEVQVPPEEGLANKAPRGIQGLKKVHTNAVLGPFMKACSKALASSFRRSKYGYAKYNYTSGSNPEEMGDWFSWYKAKGYVFLEDDFSAFDSTQGEGASEMEQTFYRRFLALLREGNKGGPRGEGLSGYLNRVEICLNKQRSTYGTCNFWEYAVPFTRKSGDQNTSIGNTLVNFSAHRYALMTFPQFREIKDFSMLGLGDDNLLALKMPVSLLEPLRAHIETTMAQLGLKAKLTIPKNPSYCSSVFVPAKRNDGSLTYVMVPELVRSLTKLGWTVNPLNKEDRKVITPAMRMKGNMLGCPGYSLMPILRVFYEHYTRMDVESHKKAEWRPYNRELKYGYRVGAASHPSLYSWMEEKYGIGLSEIRAIEDDLKGYLRDANGGVFIYNHHVLDEVLNSV